jgi:RNA polymerase II-associated protein 1
MAIPGERFHIPLDDDDDDIPGNVRTATGGLDVGFIGDIKERVPGKATPPAFPTMKSSTSGFPAHKIRSKFSQQRNTRENSKAPSPSPQAAPSTSTPKPQPSQPSKKSVSFEESDESYEEAEKQKIDAENRQRLGEMTEEEIEEERRELMANLSPAMIEMLLKRANLDDGRGDTGIEPKEAEQEFKKSETSDKEAETNDKVPQKKKVSFSADPHISTITSNDDTPPSPSEPTYAPADLPDFKTHFPHPPSSQQNPTLPVLDPADPTFLQSLHEKYFPDLPSDPTALSWMAPLPTAGSVADEESPYSPARKGYPASALRFDFRGDLLAPRTARQIPVSAGLHHHGQAPEAAGYTIPELAILARSAFPAQRCMAFQTIGRILYRLGSGGFGSEGEDVPMGLWRCVEEGRVLEVLNNEVKEGAGASRHVSSKTYATEALWLWSRGGGKVWKAA